MPSINLGKVVGDKGTSVRNRGAWNSTAQYLNDEHFVDFITYKGSLWMCAHTNLNSEPFDSNTDWTLVLSSIDTVYFEQAKVRENIASGEKASISFGKIAKFFDDLSNGAAGTLLEKTLSKDRVLISNASGGISVSGITTTILDFLSGLTSNVQEQLNAKINSSKIVQSTEITETGFLMDGKTASEKFAELNGKFKDYTFLGSNNNQEKALNIDISDYSYLYCYINYSPVNNINPTMVYKDLMVVGSNQVIRTYWSPEIGMIHGTITLSSTNTISKIHTNSSIATMFVYGRK